MTLARASFRNWLIGLSAMSAATSAALADVRPAPIFGDHMVLQQGMAVPIWGIADAGEEVTVTFGDKKASTKADDGGNWMVKLEDLKPTASGNDLTIKGNNEKKFEDVIVGEVWLASGQSNMEMSVGSSKDFEKEKAAADLPAVRMFTVKKAIAGEPVTKLEGQWELTTPETVGHFSAVGYFFARDLREQLRVPVGIIHTSWGGTPAESWTEISALDGDADLKPILSNWQKGVENYPKQHEEWEKAVAKAKAEGKNAPWEPAAPDKNPWKPAGLYNAMIAPVVPYAIKGALWYQGESNAGRAYQYRKLLPTMIGTWRKAWEQGDFPFLIVQLANFTDAKPEPGDSDWAELREAQAMTAAMPHNGLATAIDIGEAKDIHPKNKQEVGRRLALVALHDVYERSDTVCHGPEYKSMKVEGDNIRLTFQYADGLAAKGGEVKGFAIAGDDKKWHWADAKIDGSDIIVHSDEVKNPVAVRYAWATNPETANVVNAAGLPALPFRTDDWKGVTADNR